MVPVSASSQVIMASRTNSPFRQENVLWTDLQASDSQESDSEDTDSEDTDSRKANPDIPRRTYPKPDLTYGFPIISPTKSSPKGFVRDEYIQSFSLSVLGKLRTKRVHSAATSGLRNWILKGDDGKLKAPDLLCFPWAIVETKHCLGSSGEVEKCYCQAANASADAFSLQEQLLTVAFDNTPRTLSPIIAFTCIGPRIKVWLTYRWKQSDPEKTLIVSIEDAVSSGF